MKKQIIVSTLSLSFLLSPSAVPLLSGQPHAVLASALPPQADSLADRILKTRNFILPEDVAAIKDARDRLRQIKDPMLIKEIWEPIAEKKGDQEGYEFVTKKNLIDLISDMGFYYSPNLEDLETIRRKHYPLLSQLAKLSGIENGANGFDFTDVTEFVGALESRIQGKLKGKNLKELMKLMQQGESSKLINDTLTEVLSDKRLTISRILQGLGIQTNDLIEVKNKIGIVIDPGSQARMGLAFAYVRSQVTYSEERKEKGKTVIPHLSVLGKEIPDSMVTWKLLTKNPNVTIDKQGRIRLLHGESATVEVQAVLTNLDKPLLDSRTVQLGSSTEVPLPPQAAELVKKLSAIHSKILPEDLPAILEARDRLKQVKDPMLVKEIWEPIAAKKGDSQAYEFVTQENLISFISDLAIVYDPKLTDLEAIRRKYYPFFSQLVQLSGIEGGMNSVSFGDATDFINAMEKAAKNRLSEMSMADLMKLTQKDEAARLINGVLEDVLKDKRLVFSQVLRGLNIQAKDFIEVKNKIGIVADPDSRARIALAMAYIRSEIQYQQKTSQNGRVVKPELQVFGKTIPNSLLTWEIIKGHPHVKLSKDGTLTLTKGNNAKVTLKATLTAFDKPLLDEMQVEIRADKKGLDDAEEEAGE